MTTMSSREVGPQAAELGRMLFQRRQNPMAVFWIVMSILFGGIGLAALAGGVSNPKSGGLFASVLFLGMAATIVLYVVVRSRRVLRCHEFGVGSTGWFG